MRVVDAGCGKGGRVERGEREAAAVVLRQCRQELAARGGTILGEVMAGAPEMVDGQHYPAGEAYDPASHAQYFYHRHPTHGGGKGEHGHFHLFLRAEGFPAGVAPLVLPETALPLPQAMPEGAPRRRGRSDKVAHLVAIALDQQGEPIRLFTTNRWVTGETWHRAADVVRMLERFAPVQAGPSAVLDRWLGALVRLFEPEIAALLRQRDKIVMRWPQRNRAAAFENPRLEIPSSRAIDLEARLAAAETGMLAPAEGAEQRQMPRLPTMAEGWAPDQPTRRSGPP